MSSHKVAPHGAAKPRKRGIILEFFIEQENPA